VSAFFNAYTNMDGSNLITLSRTGQTLDITYQNLINTLNVKQNALTVRGDDTNVNGYRVIDSSGNVKALKAGTNMTLIQAANDITLKADLNGLLFNDQTTNLNLVRNTQQIQLAIANTATIPSLTYNYTNLIATLNGKQSTLAVNRSMTRFQLAFAP
jgi:hypothetical protein